MYLRDGLLYAQNSTQERDTKEGPIRRKERGKRRYCMRNNKDKRIEAKSEGRKKVGRKIIKLYC